jgi:hypothetical protein
MLRLPLSVLKDANGFNRKDRIKVLLNVAGIAYAIQC